MSVIGTEEMTRRNGSDIMPPKNMLYQWSCCSTEVQGSEEVELERFKILVHSLCTSAYIRLAAEKPPASISPMIPVGHRLIIHTYLFCNRNYLKTDVVGHYCLPIDAKGKE